jgi:hypothetical protein
LIWFSTLVYSYPEQPILSLTTSDNVIYVADFNNLNLPYRHFVTAYMADRDCGDVKVNLEQHHDMVTIQTDFHRKANKVWKNVPATIRNKKLNLYTNGIFNPIGVKITYIKQPNEICLGTYTVSPTIDNQTPTQIKHHLQQI